MAGKAGSDRLEGDHPPCASTSWNCHNSLVPSHCHATFISFILYTTVAQITPMLEASAARQILDTAGQFDSTNYAVITFAAIVPVVLVLIIVLRKRFFHKHKPRGSSSTADTEATPNQ